MIYGAVCWSLWGRDWAASGHTLDGDILWHYGDA